MEFLLNIFEIVLYHTFAVKMRPALFWVITQQIVLISYQCNLSALSSGDKNLDFLTLEDGTDRLFQNVGKKLPQLVA